MAKYDKQPYVDVKQYGNEDVWNGYENIVSEIKLKLKELTAERKVVAIDFYPGVRTEEVGVGIVNMLSADLTVFTDEEIFEDIDTIEEKIKEVVTDDRVFGKISLHTIENFIDDKKLNEVKTKIDNSIGIVVVYGVGVNLLVDPDIYIFADLARWEIQQRYRSGDIPNWKGRNFNEDPLRKLKRGYFFEWRVADRYKKRRFNKFDYILDTNLKNTPKMITGDAFRAGLKETVNRPFRVVPFFDPGVWGGQWMKEVCDLDRNMENYAWCFDCVPEENSLLLKVGDTIVEIPSIDVVLTHPRELLGERVHGRFGADFPIRFDFLDTIGGENLSLQVHPVVDYAQEKFGLHYTQEESYYILDTKEDKDTYVYLGIKDGVTKEKFFGDLRRAQNGLHYTQEESYYILDTKEDKDTYVYLGIKDGVTKEKFFGDLRRAQNGEGKFNAEEYSNKIKAKKHDHFLIPPGTVHCSGADTMVLEISSTPNLFTFKLWDWGRLGMDGKPRPINIAHGEEVVQFDRDTEWTMENLVNRIEVVAEGDGWIEERTGLHEKEFIETRRYWFTKKVYHNKWTMENLVNRIEVVAEGDGWIEERTGLHEKEFIETRRYWFTKKVYHNTNGGVNVLNLVEGDQAIVESPNNKFNPFIVNYAETFIVPASVGEYTIRPFGSSKNKKICTIKAYVRT